MFRLQNVIGVHICGIALHSGYTAELFQSHPRWACIAYFDGVWNTVWIILTTLLRLIFGPGRALHLLQRSSRRYQSAMGHHTSPSQAPSSHLASCKPEEI